VIHHDFIEDTLCTVGRRNSDILAVILNIHLISYHRKSLIFFFNEKLFLLQIQRFSLYKQIELFQGTQELIRSKIGKVEAEKFFQKARYVVALGSNDFINNYLMPLYSDSWTYNDETFMDYLVGTLQEQLKVYI
jgi:hypothetical protein